MQVCGIQKKVAMVYLQLIGLVLGLGGSRGSGKILSWMQVCGIQKKVAMVYLQLIGLVLGLGVYEVREFHLGFLSSLCYYRFIQSIQFKWFVKRVWGDFVFADSCATLRKFSTWTMDTALNFT